MPIPDYGTCMLPLLKFVADGEHHTVKQLSQRVADHFNLTEKKCQQFLPGRLKELGTRVEL